MLLTEYNEARQMAMVYKEGETKGESRLAALVFRLMAQGRGDDVVRAACDPHVRAKLLQESDLDH